MDTTSWVSVYFYDQICKWVSNILFQRQAHIDCIFFYEEGAHQRTQILESSLNSMGLKTGAFFLKKKDHVGLNWNSSGGKKFQFRRIVAFKHMLWILGRIYGLGKQFQIRYEWNIYDAEEEAIKMQLVLEGYEQAGKRTLLRYCALTNKRDFTRVSAKFQILLQVVSADT